MPNEYSEMYKGLFAKYLAFALAKQTERARLGLPPAIVNTEQELQEWLQSEQATHRGVVVYDEAPGFISQERIDNFQKLPDIQIDEYIFDIFVDSDDVYSQDAIIELCRHKGYGNGRIALIPEILNRMVNNKILDKITNYGINRENNYTRVTEVVVYKYYRLGEQH